MIGGSLFTGIAGLDLGLELAGAVTSWAWQCEIDPDAIKVLEHRYPTVKRYTDVRQIDERATRPGLICGGFPCQDISVAGKGEGIDGARSGLWSEYARIIRLLRPRFVFVENVANLVNLGLDRVLGDLAACGYDAEWDVFRASDVGAPHKRARLFLLARTVGLADAHGDAVRIEPERDQRGRRGERAAECGDAEPLDVGEDVADAAGERWDEGGGEPGNGKRARRTFWGGFAQPRGRGGEAARVGQADTDSEGLEGPGLQRPAPDHGASVGQAHANGGRCEPERDAQRTGIEGASGDLIDGRDCAGRQHRFPPGPGGIADWDGPQPAVRRGDDGLYPGMDLRFAASVGPADQLRLLGNAVVPQQAALAFRVLAERLGVGGLAA